MEEERGGGREMAAEKEKAWNEEEEAFRDKRGKRPSFPTSAYTTAAAAPLPQQSHSLIGAARQPSQAGPLKNGWGGERWVYCSSGW